MTFKEIIEQLEKSDLRRIDGGFAVGNTRFKYIAYTIKHPAGKATIRVDVRRERE